MLQGYHICLRPLFPSLALFIQHQPGFSDKRLSSRLQTCPYKHDLEVHAAMWLQVTNTHSVCVVRSCGAYGSLRVGVCVSYLCVLWLSLPGHVNSFRHTREFMSRAHPQGFGLGLVCRTGHENALGTWRHKAICVYGSTRGMRSGWQRDAGSEGSLFLTSLWACEVSVPVKPQTCCLQWFVHGVCKHTRVFFLHRASECKGLQQSNRFYNVTTACIYIPFL